MKVFTISEMIALLKAWQPRFVIGRFGFETGSDGFLTVSSDVVDGTYLKAIQNPAGLLLTLVSFGVEKSSLYLSSELLDVFLTIKNNK